ncbi:MaoC family dehydratase N-terminal domain-containing protein [Pseudonocardia sp. RS010]|uniref:FAS1-like dehydratase domain-containing protein n=1 Tax=Pseudonocardia sp. RS010 TaxID=3385979 RepID=UPI0039A1598D
MRSETTDGLDREWQGRSFPPVTATVERGRLRAFARATGQTDPVYFDLDAARAAGHPDLLAPPTVLFFLAQEDPALFSHLEAIGAAVSTVLHGAQTFRYHRAVHAGDELTLVTTIGRMWRSRDGRFDFAERHGAITDAATGRRVADSDDVLITRLGSEPSPERRDAKAETPLDPAQFTLHAPPVSRATLAMFAGASGDANPLHIDSDAARAAGLADVIAPGMLSMAYLGRLLTDAVRQEDLREFSVRFRAATPVHAVPTCRGTLLDSPDAAGHRRFSLAVTLADGTTTLTGHAVVSGGLRGEGPR